MKEFDPFSYISDAVVTDPVSEEHDTHGRENNRIHKSFVNKEETDTYFNTFDQATASFVLDLSENLIDIYEQYDVQIAELGKLFGINTNPSTRDVEAVYASENGLQIQGSGEEDTGTTFLTRQAMENAYKEGKGALGILSDGYSVLEAMGYSFGTSNDYSNPDGSFRGILDEVEKDQAAQILEQYLKKELNVTDEATINTLQEVLVTNAVDIDGKEGSDFFDLFYPEYGPDGPTRRELKDPKPTYADFEPYLSVENQSSNSENTNLPQSEISYPDQNGNGWIHKDENRQAFMDQFGAYLWSEGLTFDDAFAVLKSLMGHDVDKNLHSDILDLFFVDKVFKKPEDLMSIVENYKDSDGDSKINIIDDDDNNNMIADASEHAGSTVDSDAGGTSDVHELHMGTNPNEKSDDLVLSGSFPMEHFRVFDSNVSNLADSEVIFFPFIHGNASDETGLLGDQKELEISQFVDKFHQQYPEKKLVVLLEGFESGQVIDIEQYRNALSFKYQANADAALVAGWDNMTANTQTMAEAENVLGYTNILWENGFPFDMEGINDPVAIAGSQMFKNIDRYMDARNVSLNNTIEKYVKEGYTVIVTAGQAHYFSSPEVRDIVDDYKYTVYYDQIDATELSK